MINAIGMQERHAQRLRRQATLHAGIHDIAQRIHVPLERGEDNVDLFEGAVCQLDRGAVFGIIHHHGQAADRTTLLMEESSSPESILQVIAALGVTNAALRAR